MKIAYLIAAHTDPKHLGRLIEALNINGHTDFYVHLDKRVELNVFQTEANIRIGNVTWISDRVIAKWGGYSQCRYQKALIKSCIKSGNLYDRVFFLSGLDYPIWSNCKILSYLKKHPDLEIIAGKNISETNDNLQLRKIKNYHFFRDLPISNNKLHRIIKGFAQLAMRYIPIKRKGYIVTKGKKVNIYHGSSWWCVTGGCLRYIYNELISNPVWERFFKFAYTPDELMIQTIVFNSPFSRNALLFPDSVRELPSLTPLHYIEYDKSIAVFSEKDYEKIMSSGKMFARKLVTGLSDKLMDLIDEKRSVKSECK